MYLIHMQMLVLVAQQGRGDLVVLVVQTQELHFDQENLLDREDPQWTHPLDPKDTNIKTLFFNAAVVRIKFYFVLDTHTVQSNDLYNLEFCTHNLLWTMSQYTTP